MEAGPGLRARFVGEGPSTSGPSAGSGPVIVFQQRMTHYLSLFYWEHGDLEMDTRIPDA